MQKRQERGERGTGKENGEQGWLDSVRRSLLYHHAFCPFVILLNVNLTPIAFEIWPKINVFVTNTCIPGTYYSSSEAKSPKKAGPSLGVSGGAPSPARGEAGSWLRRERPVVQVQYTGI